LGTSRKSGRRKAHSRVKLASFVDRPKLRSVAPGQRKRS
jgi:hypothetical protein